MANARSSKFPNVPSQRKILALLDRFKSASTEEIQVEVNKHLAAVSNSKTVFMVWIVPSVGTGVVQVVGGSILEEHIEFQVPLSKSLPKPLSRVNYFYKAIEELLPTYLSKQIKGGSKLTIPNEIHSQDLFGVVYFTESQHFAKSRGKLKEILRYTGPMLLATFKLWREESRRVMNQRLLKVAETLFSNLGDPENALPYLCQEAQLFIGAERCSLFVVSEDKKYLTAKVFDGIQDRRLDDIKIPVTKSVSGRVLSTQKSHVTRDAQSNPRFNKIYDSFTGTTTKNMLSIPVNDSWKRIVGVAIITNKPSGFTALDEEGANIFATYFGMGLMHCLVHRRINQSQARIRIAYELLMHHLTVSEDAVQQVMHNWHGYELPSLLDYKWNCREATPEFTPTLSLFMYESLGSIQSCRMSKATISRFILVVRKHYREVPYHNWLHAFSVGHFVFCLIKNLELVENSIITELEAVALLSASICHDLDHRGTTNSFQTLTKNSLASLYNCEGSIMERHHFSQVLSILNNKGCNIFENFDAATYRRVIDLIRVIILATDLAENSKNFHKQQLAIKSFDPSRRDHRQQLLCLLMRAADFNDQVKEWRSTKIAAGLLYEEFFNQGDQEKEMNLTPSCSMDREKADIPMLEVEFLTEVCLPLFKLLNRLFPEIETCITAIKDNIAKWKKAQVWMSKKLFDAGPINLLKNPALDAYVLKNTSLRQVHMH